MISFESDNFRSNIFFKTIYLFILLLLVKGNTMYITGMDTRTTQVIPTRQEDYPVCAHRTPRLTHVPTRPHSATVITRRY